MSGVAGGTRPAVAERHAQYAMRRFGLRREELPIWRELKRQKMRGAGANREAAELVKDSRSEED